MNSLDIAKSPAQTRVVVAMSGGVDSSVVAALLATEGYDVVGVTLRLYASPPVGRKGSCCAGRDIGDARAVAARLGVPHYVLDYEERFRRSVIAPFAESYVAGETPVPCVACNSSVKFTDLLDVARDLGADALATGHYCATRRLGDGRRGLFRGADNARDQSYFLFATTRDQLTMLRCPLGDLPKTQVREIARAHGLVTADKPDSQDICFVPSGRYSDIVARLMPEAMAAGEIVDQADNVLGHHDGIAGFTVGQRKGLNLGGRTEPLFVTRIDAARARIVVGPRAALETTRLHLRDVNWLGDDALTESPRRDLFVRTRSTRAPVPARLLVEDGQAMIDFPAPETNVSPGQACVFYATDQAGGRVLGGGTVVRVPAPVTRALEPANA